MEISFDPAKNCKNIGERGLDFERARDFDFGSALIGSVERNGELRWVALGYLDGVVHLLCFLALPRRHSSDQLSQGWTKGEAAYDREKRMAIAEG